MKHLQKITFFLTIFFFTTGTHSDENLTNIKKLDSFFEKGALSKKEYIAAKEYLDGKTENLKKKNFLLTKEKKSKNKKKILDKIKKDFKIPEFTPKEVADLGTPKKLSIEDYPKNMRKIFKGSKSSFSGQGKKAGQHLYQTFTKSPAYGARYPGKMIKGMAMYELFYAEKLYAARKSLERYKNNWQNKNSKILHMKKDKKEINSLIGMNKGRENMRKALGIPMDESPEVAIKKFWTLGEFLNLGKPVKLAKVDPELKKRKKLINDYKVEIATLKKKLQTEKEENSKKIDLE